MAVQAFAEWLLRLLEATVCLEEGYAEVEGPDRGSCGRITPMSNGREVTGFLLSTKMEPGLRDPFSNDLMPNRLAPGYGRYVPLGNRSIAELERLVRFTCNISDSAGELRVRGRIPKHARNKIASRLDAEDRLIAIYSHRAFDGLPNFHAERRASNLPDLDRIDYDYRRFFVPIVYAIEQWHTGEWQPDFLVFESDAGGYVQLNRDSDSRLIIAESMSELFKAKSEIAVVGDHASIAYGLGWRSDDRMANDFALFTLPSPLSRVALAHWIMVSMVRLHSLSENSELQITHSDIDMAFEETRTIRIVKQDVLDENELEDDEESEE